MPTFGRRYTSIKHSDREGSSVIHSQLNGDCEFGLHLIGIDFQKKRGMHRSKFRMIKQEAISVKLKSLVMKKPIELLLILTILIN